MPNPRITLTAEQAEAFGRELDALKARIVDDLGERDAAYIRRVIKTQRSLEIGGRAMLFAGIVPPAWLAGTAMLATAKILDNMEIGHNVMHGQYDWMEDPATSSRAFDWDNACPADQWRHSHNVVHQCTSSSPAWCARSSGSRCRIARRPTHLPQRPPGLPDSRARDVAGARVTAGNTGTST